MDSSNVPQRPDKKEPASLSFDSQAVHAGNSPDATTGAIHEARPCRDDRQSDHQSG